MSAAERFVIHRLKKKLKRGGQHSAVTSCLGAHTCLKCTNLGLKTQQQMCVTLCVTVCPSLRLVYIFLKNNTHRQKCKHNNRSKLIVVNWSIIVVVDGALFRLVLVPEPCPEGGIGGMERWSMGGRSLTRTEEGLCWCGSITTGVDWHNHACSVAGSGQRDTESLWVERVTVTAASKQRKSCMFGE